MSPQYFQAIHETLERDTESGGKTNYPSNSWFSFREHDGYPRL
jgi:hypothetical protein